MNVIKVLILIGLVAVVASLGSALYYLSSGHGDSKKLARALTVRIALSLVIFVLLMLAWWLGLISPHGAGE